MYVRGSLYFLCYVSFQETTVYPSMNYVWNFMDNNKTQLINDLSGGELGMCIRTA